MFAGIYGSVKVLISLPGSNQVDTAKKEEINNLMTIINNNFIQIACKNQLLIWCKFSD